MAVEYRCVSRRPDSVSPMPPPPLPVLLILAIPSRSDGHAQDRVDHRHHWPGRFLPGGAAA
eukprot:6955785-Pyramimonas_sp.AAC.1